MSELVDKVAFWKQRERSLIAKKQRLEDKLDTVRWKIEKYLKPIKLKKERLPSYAVMDHVSKIIVFRGSTKKSKRL